MFFYNYKFVLKKVSKSDIFFTDSLYYQLNLERFKSYHLNIDEINLFYFFETLKNNKLRSKKINKPTIKDMAILLKTELLEKVVAK